MPTTTSRTTQRSDGHGVNTSWNSPRGSVISGEPIRLALSSASPWNPPLCLCEPLERRPELRLAVFVEVVTLAPLSTRTPCIRSQMRRSSRSCSSAVQARTCRRGINEIKRLQSPTPDRPTALRSSFGARRYRRSMLSGDQSLFAIPFADTLSDNGHWSRVEILHAFIGRT